MVINALIIMNNIDLFTFYTCQLLHEADTNM